VEPTNVQEGSEREEVVRVMIQRENEVIHHRIAWLATVEAFLFSVLGVAWDKQGTGPLILLLCILGITMALIAFFALHGATLAIKRLFEWWEIKKPEDYSGPGVIGLPLPKSPILRFIGPWTFIPILFIIAWIGVWSMKGYPLY